MRKYSLKFFDGVPQKEIAKADVLGVNIVDLLSEKSGFLKSKSEAQREIKRKCNLCQQAKVNDTFTANETDLIDGKFLLLQKVKNYFIVRAN